MNMKHKLKFIIISSASCCSKPWLMSDRRGETEKCYKSKFSCMNSNDLIFPCSTKQLWMDDWVSQTNLRTWCSDSWMNHSEQSVIHIKWSIENIKLLFTNQTPLLYSWTLMINYFYCSIFYAWELLEVTSWLVKLKWINEYINKKSLEFIDTILLQYVTFGDRI